MKKYEKWLTTYTKRLVTVIVTVSLFDLQLSYILAFLGRDLIAESLSSTIAEVIVGTVMVYGLKALFETFFEKRETRLERQEKMKERNAKG